MQIVEPEISETIFKSSLKVHKLLGPGLLESAYQQCLFLELISQGLHVKREQSVDIEYEGAVVPNAFRIDLFVEEKVIVECKSVEVLAPVHTAQVLTYLKLTGTQLGILINFNVKLLKEGYKRLVL